MSYDTMNIESGCNIENCECKGYTKSNPAKFGKETRGAGMTEEQIEELGGLDSEDIPEASEEWPLCTCGHFAEDHD